MSNVFNEIYENNEWGFGSGVGSLPLNNIEYIRLVQTFIRANAITSVVDLGCGDWQFSQFIDWSSATYLGLDVAEEVVKHNQRRFTRENVSFAKYETGQEIPFCDLALCKDVFQHLPNQTIRETLERLKSRARFLLITNDEWPCAELTNTEIDAGGWRPICLGKPPFDETAPVILTWTIEFGIKWTGWNPTGKATCFISGDRLSG